MMTTKRTAIRGRLAVRRAANRPPWGRWKSGHRTIVAPLAATVAATLAATVALRMGVALARAERDRRSARTRRARDRQFALAPGERPEDGVRRMALGQLDLAIELLEGAGKPVSAATAVHETRKSLKRLRALVRLIEGELGEEQFIREDAVLRDAGLRLAGARDAEVMVTTLDLLLAAHPKLARRPGVAKLRVQLVAERYGASRRASGDTSARAEVLGELHALRGRVAGWSLPHREGISTLEPGLRSIYRQGAQRRRRAARGRGHKGHAMHEWRKRVKDLRYVVEILEPRDLGSVRKRDRRSGRAPDREAQGEIRGKARRADELGELLGEDHDLWLLAQRLKQSPPAGGGRQPEVGKGARKALLGVIARRRRRVRREALRKGERLYRHPPKRFVRRVGDAYERSPLSRP